MRNTNSNKEWFMRVFLVLIFLTVVGGCDAFDKIGSGRIANPPETVRATDELGKSKLHEWTGTFGESRLVNIQPDLAEDTPLVIEIGVNEKSLKEIPLEEKYNHNLKFPYAVWLRKPGVIIFANVNDDNTVYSISYWENK